ncbi:MAG: 4-hydroxy-tetrahydrodipicolinate synthase [Clostridiales bacterium]|nr:MAG: 4-hydroxy-tetrahydrodipicolinate synthase [Clostridiales bacterium]
MAKKTIFTGAGVAITTPFTKDDKINYPVYDSMIEYQISNKTDAIVVCGTTGESSTLTDDEHKEIIKHTVDYVAGRVPVIAGTGSNETAYALELSEYAEKAGADAILMVTPYYNKTTQKGLVAHYFHIADRVNVPMILYNVPGRTGMNIKPETYKELSKHQNIVAVKEANGDVCSTIRTIDLCGDDLDVYSGEDGLITPMLSVGAKGVISVLSNIVPRQTHDICELFFNGKVAESAALQTKLIKLVDALFMETNPIPVKTAQNIIGIDVGHLRLPLTDMTEENFIKLKNILKEYGF